MSDEYNEILCNSKLYGYDRSEIRNILELDEMKDLIDKVGTRSESGDKEITIDDILVPVNMLINIKNIVEGREKSLVNEFASDLNVAIEKELSRREAEK